MLSIHGWSNPSLPFARKSRGVVAKGAMLHTRGVGTHVLDSFTPMSIVGRTPNSRDVEKLRRLGDEVSDTRQQPQEHAIIARPMSILHPSAGGRTNAAKPARHDSMPGEPGRGFRILRNSLIPDTFIYESSIASKSSLSMDVVTSADLETLPSYSLPYKANAHHPDDTDQFITVPVLRITNGDPDNTAPIAITRPPSAPFLPLHTSMPDEEPVNGPRSRPRRASINRRNSKSPPRVPQTEATCNSDSDGTLIQEVTPPNPRGRPLIAPPLKEAPLPRQRFSPERNVMMEKYEANFAVDGGQAIEVFNSMRTVRFSDDLICPSPIRACHRRQGWYNRRGDQLWTNDGQFVTPEHGFDYPPDLDEYPEVGAGWMNEEGVRIDMEHRLVPKQPLRSALKRCLNP